MTTNIQNNAKICQEKIDFECILKDLNIDLDPIDSDNFDIVQYINELFPSEQSLSSIDKVISSISEKIEDIDAQTKKIIRGQWKMEEQGQKVVEEASQLIQSLFTKIREVQERATSSEEMVAEITRDIQQLDQAKRNLTVSITTLNNLALIVSDIDRLNAILFMNNTHQSDQDKSKNVKNPFDQEKMPSILSSIEIEDHLGRAQRLMVPMLVTYSSVPAVRELDLEMKRIYTTVNERLSAEMKELLNGPSARILTENAPKILSGCRLLDLLPTDNMRTELLKWFISRQLIEYQELYEPSQAVAWLDKIDHRYAWLRTNLVPLERKIRALFPAEWLVLERLIVEFCRITRSDLEVTMKRRHTEITHNILIFALQRTLAFENSLSKVVTGATLLESKQPKTITIETTKEAKKDSTNPFGSEDEDDGEESEQETKQLDEENDKTANPDAHTTVSSSPFEGIISSCFEAYFDRYLNNVERALQDQLKTRLIGDHTVNKSSLSNREFSEVFRDSNNGGGGKNQTGGPGNDMAENTLYSATDLFLLYKQLLKQTLQLNRGSGLMGLVSLLRKYLTEYTEKVLLPAIPGLSASSAVGGSGAAAGKSFSLASFGIGRDSDVGGSMDSTVSALTAASNISNHFFANLLRDEQPIRLSKEEIIRVCVILVTASYCIKTVEELEKRLKSEARPPSLSKSISFAGEVDGFTACRSTCVHRLVVDLEASVIPQLAKMTKMPWNSITSVGDQSAYVTAIVGHLKTQLPLIRDTLFSVRAHFTQICIKFADAIISRFVASLYRCKPVNTFGAEQLLLDTQCLKSALFQLPLFGTKISQPPPRSFTGLVQEGMAHAERIIKSVMLPIGSVSNSRDENLSFPVAHANTAAAASTNPFDAPPSSTQIFKEEQTAATSVDSFVMGPIDAKAAATFVASFLQLVPSADVSIMQKVLDMKGIKRSEQFIILDNFRQALKTRTEVDTISSSNQSTALPRSSSAEGNLLSLKNRKEGSLRETLLRK